MGYLLFIFTRAILNQRVSLSLFLVNKITFPDLSL